MGMNFESKKNVCRRKKVRKKIAGRKRGEKQTTGKIVCWKRKGIYSSVGFIWRRSNGVI